MQLLNTRGCVQECHECLILKGIINHSDLKWFKTFFSKSHSIWRSHSKRLHKHIHHKISKLASGNNTIPSFLISKSSYFFMKISNICIVLQVQKNAHGFDQLIEGTINNFNYSVISCNFNQLSSLVQLSSFLLPFLHRTHLSDPDRPWFLL